MNNSERLQIIEGALYIVGNDGISVQQISRMLSIEESDALQLLQELINSYNMNENKGLQILEMADEKYIMATLKKHAKYYEQLALENQTSSLSQAALETLAIVAYQQPVTKNEVEEIRGVSCDSSFQTLLQRGMIEEAGRKQAVGRARLYRTTTDFLNSFGLKSLSDLPPVPDLTINEEEQIRNLFAERE